MKVSVNWLKDYLNLDNYSYKDLFKIFSTHIVEIESDYKLVEATNLTVGYVLECDKHPDSDHLNVCKVQIDENTVSQIVCGAPNVKKGIKVIVALPGAVLPGDFEIKPSVIRGVESNGMCCSLQELGIEEKYVEEEYKDGIYILDDDAVVGTSPLEYLKFDDYVYDLDLTANRSDLLSIEGVAYDLGAALNQKVKEKKFILKEVEEKNPINVKVLTKKCSKYLTRTIKNVKIGKSPVWMRERLIASGIRPINNVVDITNYVLMELGQPLHSFDADKLGEHIVVRNAKKGEELTTLDDISRDLVEDDILITDGKTPLCLAGVMGGASTEITSESKNVVLEAAYFDPLSIRKTSKRLNLKSESSTRFERIIDYKRVERALDYAAYLMHKYAKGDVLKGVNGISEEVEDKHVLITTDKINKVLGTSFENKEVEDFFNRYQYSYTKNKGSYDITLPHRRMDLLENYQDIIEDVARLYGYDNIPTELAMTNSSGKLTDKQLFVRNLRHALYGLGLKETVNYSLTDELTNNDFALDKLSDVKVLMPMVDNMTVMRHSLVNGLIKNVNYNLAHKQNDLAFFEIGKRYSLESEDLMFAGAFEGLFESSTWQKEKSVVDFFLVKGLLESVFSKFGFNASYCPIDEKLKNMHPGRSAYIKVSNKVVGYLGQLHPRYVKENDTYGMYVFEINLDLLYSLRNKTFEYKSISKYPVTSRDLAIVLDKDIPASKVIDVINMVAKKNLISTKIFDCYVGENVLSNEKSLAISLTFGSNEKTLESNDVDKIIHSILNRLDALLKAHLR